MVRSLALDAALEAQTVARARVLLAGDVGGQAAWRPTLLERLAGRLRRTGDTVLTAPTGRGGAWRLAELVVTAWSARTQVDVAVVEVHGEAGLRHAEALTRTLGRAGVPVVHLLRGADLAHADPGRLRRLLASGAASVALSGHLHEALEPLGGVTDVIADPVDAGSYPFRPRRTAGPSVLWLAVEDGLDAAAEALAALRASHPEAAMTVVVPGPSSRAALEATQRWGVEGALRLARPRVDGAGALLAEHDVLLNAADVDDAPLGVTEAMAAGLCVVSTYEGGAGYLVTDGVDGLLVPPGDAAAAAEAVRRVVEDPELAERLSRAARVRAESLDWSRALPRWKALLAGAARRGGGAR